MSKTGKGNNVPRIPGIPQQEGSSETNPYETLGQMAANIAINAMDLTQAARTAYCTKELLTNPAMMLNSVELMAKTASSIALDMAERMTHLVSSQITQALSQINGTFISLTTNALGFVNGLRTFLDSVKKLLQVIGNFIDNLKIDANAEYDDFCKKEDCEFMFAMMGACLLGRLLGNKLQEFEQNVSNKIINAGSDFNQAVADSLYTANNISGFLEREQFMMQKAAKQLDGLHRMTDSTNNKIFNSVSVKVDSQPQQASNATTEEQTSKQKTEQKAGLINQALSKLKGDSKTIEDKNKK